MHRWILLITVLGASTAAAQTVAPEPPATPDLNTALAQADTSERPNDADEDAERGDAEDDDVVVVRAIRRSLAESLENKRQAPDIRDVITTADIGDFPDQNLAEAAQRLPGVAITRDQGEGRFVTIRGLPPELNRVSWNGITLPSSEDDRAVPLDIFSADLFGTVAVVKSLRAEQDIGAVGGSLNLSTPSPLQLPDGTVSLTARGFYNTLAEEIGPAFAAIGSKRFLDDRFGALVGITYSDRRIRQDTNSSGGWSPVGEEFVETGDEEIDNLLAWENGQLRLFDEERERLTALIALEAELGSAGRYRFDTMISSFEVDAKRYQFLHRFKGGSEIRNVVSDGIKVVSADFIGAQMGVNQRISSEDTDATLSRLRGDWRLGQNWTIDAQAGWMQIENSRPVDQRFVWRPSGFDIGYDVSDPYDPQYRYLNLSQDEAISNAALYDNIRQIVLDPREADDETVDLKLNSRHALPGNGFLRDVAFGVAWKNRNKDRVQTRFRDRSLSAPLADFLDGSFAIPGNGEYLDGRFPWWGDVIADFDLLDAGLIPPGGYDFEPDLLNSFDIEETITAGYVRADFALGNATGNVGVRLVNTDFTADGFGEVNGELGPVTFSDDYVEALPSGTLNVPLDDDLMLRASAGRTMVPPSFTDLAPRRTVNEEAQGINQGNPDLDPFLVNQADLSLEWYFGDESLLAAALLYKDVESFIFDQTRRITLDDPERFGVDPSLAGEQFTITQPLNGSGAEVWGAELSWQQPFDFLPPALEGFGIRANYTWLDSNADFTANETGSAADVEDQGGPGTTQEFGLPGISDHVVNTTLYYEAHGWTARLSWNLRSSFLVSPAGSEGQPEYVDDFDQLDAFVGYAINDNVTVFAEAFNLTDEAFRRYSQPGFKIEEYSLNGIRVFAGIRARF
jgi:iron complex outermembrane receptor protein